MCGKSGENKHKDVSQPLPNSRSNLTECMEIEWHTDCCKVEIYDDDTQQWIDGFLTKSAGSSTRHTGRVRLRRAT